MTSWVHKTRPGPWVPNPRPLWECDACHGYAWIRTPHCPWCGVEMQQTPTAPETENWPFMKREDL